MIPIVSTTGVYSDEKEGTLLPATKMLTTCMFIPVIKIICEYRTSFTCTFNVDQCLKTKCKYSSFGIQMYWIES